MRPVTGAAPGASLHDHWAFARDHARAAVPGEMQAFEDAHADMQPSRAHIRRLRRDRSDAFTCPPRGPAPAVLPTMAFFHDQLRQIQSGKVSQPEPPAMRYDASRHEFVPRG